MLWKGNRKRKKVNTRCCFCTGIESQINFFWHSTETPLKQECGVVAVVLCSVAEVVLCGPVLCEKATMWCGMRVVWCGVVQYDNIRSEELCQSHTNTSIVVGV